MSTQTYVIYDKYNGHIVCESRIITGFLTTQLRQNSTYGIRI